MTVKNNAFVAAAATLLNVTPTAGEFPLIESMVDNIQIKKFEAAEINDGSGKVIVFVTVMDGAVEVVRPIADSNGNVKLFSDATSVVGMVKKATLVAGCSMRFVRFNKVGTIGNPLASLKAKYKRAKVENVGAAAKVVTITAEKSAAVSQGWDTAIGSPENAEYLDLVDRFNALTEWADTTAAMKTSLSAALTAAGIDPATVV
jgi:hypothetical protein